MNSPRTRIEQLNGWTPAEAERELLSCCGSAAWTRRMIQQRPFVNFEELFATAERTWWQLERDDWLEAFSRHPKVGAQAAESELASGQLAYRTWPLATDHRPLTTT